MKVYIQVWPNMTASLLTANGQVIWTFSSAAEAEQACRDWHSIVQDDAGCCEFSVEGETLTCCLG